MSGWWLLFPLCPSAALPHECVRKVRSVQKSREVIYHLRMIAPCAVKAIRFNACIHAAPKSLAYFARLLFFFYVRRARPTRCTCTTSVSRDHQCPENSFRSVYSRFVRSTRHFVAKFTSLRCDSIARYVYHGTRIRSTFSHVNWKIPPWFKPQLSLFGRYTNEATASVTAN